MDVTRLDASLFAAEAVDAETRAFNAHFAGQRAAYADLPVDEARAEQERLRGQSPSAMARERTIAGRAGVVRLREFVPERVQGVFVYMHGGGWWLGGRHHQDQRLEQIARGCNVAVVSVGYRLAPEDPYPAGPDDCEAAALWVASHAKAEYGSEKLVIGGSSAGAHLAAVSLLRLRDRHKVTPFAGASLQFGVYDLRLTPSASNWLLSGAVDMFVPEEKRRDPDVSPLFAELSRMPPALFTVGTVDPLLDDTLFMHARWTAAGNRAELGVYPGGPHGFTSQPLQIGRQCNEQIDGFIRRSVG
ncbi:MAG: alpha/beta hydrolase [Dehalococcoidia bacterium]|nr:alpha/beta hydrolase [Dehalococcoidia bacterium]